MQRAERDWLLSFGETSQKTQVRRSLHLSSVRVRSCCLVFFVSLLHSANRHRWLFYLVFSCVFLVQIINLVCPLSRKWVVHHFCLHQLWSMTSSHIHLLLRHLVAVLKLTHIPSLFCDSAVCHPSKCSGLLWIWSHPQFYTAFWFFP